MNDLISRQDAIRWVKTECNPYGKPTIDFESGKKVIDYLEQMPSAEVTVEELKQIANEMGYNIIKKQEYIKLLPCKCGCTRREHWYGVKKDDAYILKCSNCGATAMGSTEREAKLNWNRMVSEE